MTSSMEFMICHFSHKDFPVYRIFLRWSGLLCPKRPRCFNQAKKFKWLDRKILCNSRHTQNDILQFRANSSSEPWLKYDTSKCTLRNRLPSIINSDSSDITEKISTHTLCGFKFYLKRTYLGSYESDCFIVNCHNCRLTTQT